MSSLGPASLNNASLPSVPPAALHRSASMYEDIDTAIAQVRDQINGMSRQIDGMTELLGFLTRMRSAQVMTPPFLHFSPAPFGGTHASLAPPSPALSLPNHQQAQHASLEFIHGRKVFAPIAPPSPAAPATPATPAAPEPKMERQPTPVPEVPEDAPDAETKDTDAPLPEIDYTGFKYLFSFADDAKNPIVHIDAAYVDTIDPNHLLDYVERKYAGAANNKEFTDFAYHVYCTTPAQVARWSKTKVSKKQIYLLKPSDVRARATVITKQVGFEMDRLIIYVGVPSHDFQKYTARNVTIPGRQWIDCYVFDGAELDMFKTPDGRSMVRPVVMLADIEDGYLHYS